MDKNTVRLLQLLVGLSLLASNTRMHSATNVLWFQFEEP